MITLTESYDGRRLDALDNTVDLLLSRYAFEKQSPYLSVNVLADWFRVLQPGGKIIMIVQNLEALCQAFAEADMQHKYNIANAIYNTKNQFGWWPDSIVDHLRIAGFIESEVITDGLDLQVCAIKPLPNKTYLHNRDLSLYEEIFKLNSYNITDQELRNKTIIDVGANIGYFSLLCVEHGVKKVIAVEAQPTVFNTGLIPLTKDYPDQIVPINLAMTNSDSDTVYIKNYHVGSRFGLGAEFIVPAEKVSTITLKTLSDQYPEATLLKMDVEGSEYDIVLNSSPDILRRFEIIYIEIHGKLNPNPNYRGIKMVEDYLVGSGFKKVFEGICKVWTDQTDEDETINEKWVRQ